ncbi:MAG: hypothetical protein ACAI44_38605 [Candidatus Sericytochromatia bacterium]
MRVDAQTLRELELFSGPDGGQSIFEAFKRTLTRGSLLPAWRRTIPWI